MYKSLQKIKHEYFFALLIIVLILPEYTTKIRVEYEFATRRGCTENVKRVVIVLC